MNYRLVAKGLYITPSTILVTMEFKSIHWDPPITVQQGDLIAVSQPHPSISIVRTLYVDNIASTSYRTSLGTTAIDLTNSAIVISNQLVLLYPITSMYLLICIIYVYIFLYRWKLC